MKCVTVLFALLAAPTLSAQTPLYRDETLARLPALLAGQCMDAAAGDADGDGDLDIALAMEFSPNILLFNDGEGNFTIDPAALPVTEHDSEDVAFADFDGDGDADLVLVSEDDRIDELYLNDGSGTFSDASERLVWRDVSNALAVIDLNADGAPDLLTGNVGINRALINDGTGRFVDRTDALWPQDGESRTQDLEIADVDGDGDMDVIVANEGQNQLYLNTDGRLVDVTRRDLPEREDESREIRAADVDGDADLDLIVANVSFIMSAPEDDYILLNDGAGAFSISMERFPENAQNNFTVQAVDLDDDGDADLLIPDTQFSQNVGEILALLNDGDGAFNVASSGSVFSSEVRGNGFDIEVADFDGDGADDLFLCNRASSPRPGEAARSGGLQRLLIRATGR